MDAATALVYVILGAFLGAAGQGARAVVGIKKSHDKMTTSEDAKGEWFDPKRLTVSLMIGGIAGSLGATLLLGAEIDKQFLLAMIAAGYAGTDFIEGFMRKNIPEG